MFDRIRKAFSRDQAPDASAPVPASSSDPVSEWAATQGFAYSGQGAGATFAVDGTVGGKPWRLESGRPTRRYIEGEELRARADLGVDPDVLILLLNRPLKDSLEKQAYALFTDTLQTTADPNLPEEMRLLSMFEEKGWDAPPRTFWARYSVVADNRDHAMAWVDAGLVKLLLEWPAPAPSVTVPFILMLLRGKAYMRMQLSSSQLPAVQHAAAVFSGACETALGAFRKPGT